MQLSLEISQGGNQIQAYRQGCVTINGQEYSQPLMIMPNHLVSPWGPTTAALLTENDFLSLLSFEPELVLLGTGQDLKTRSIQWPNPALYACLTSQQIGVEVMDIGAACRTYTLLKSEERQVMALLFIG